MSHVSTNLAALYGGAMGLTDPLLYHVVTITESTALVPGDGVILCRAIQPITVILPPAGLCRGRAFIIMKIDKGPGAVTITGQDPTDTINDARFYSFTNPYRAVWVLSDGAVWWVISII